MDGQALDRQRLELARRLRDRRGEIESAILTRVYAISDPGETDDTEYVHGLRVAVAAALDYGLTAVERGERPSRTPGILLAQARAAARTGVGLDTVLRRYSAGHTLLIDFLIEEAERMGLAARASLRAIFRPQASVFEGLLSALSEEHTRESRLRLQTPEQRRAALVDRLLAGELLDAAELAYDLGGGHIGLVAVGSGGEEAVRAAAMRLDCRLLSVRRGEETVWAWFGSRRPLDLGDVERVLAAELTPRICLATGEPARRIGGWRLTHQQAKAVLPVALRRRGDLIRYVDAALLATGLQDKVLVDSLLSIYIDPLRDAHDDGEALCDVLRAYFAAGRNASSAAAMLGISRQTVASRLRAAEEHIGRPVTDCAMQLELALQLAAVGGPMHVPEGGSLSPLR